MLILFPFYHCATCAVSPGDRYPLLVVYSIVYSDPLSSHDIRGSYWTGIIHSICFSCSFNYEDVSKQREGELMFVSSLSILKMTLLINISCLTFAFM